jgi:hypothetical protein
LVKTAQVAGTDTCASPKATGTHPVGVAEMSTAGIGLVTVVVGESTGELVQAVRIRATTSNTNARGLLVLMLTGTS